MKKGRVRIWGNVRRTTTKWLGEMAQRLSALDLWPRERLIGIAHKE